MQIKVECIPSLKNAVVAFKDEQYHVVLEMLGIITSKKIYHFYEHWYSLCSAVVRWECGVRQEGVLSPV